MAIVLKTISDSKEAQADLAKLRGSVDGIQQSVNNVSSGFLNFTKILGAGLAGFAAIQTFTKYSDQLTNLETKLKLATTGQAEFNFALSNVRKTANATRTDLASVASLYSRLSMSAKDFGASQGDIAKATSLITKSISASGSGAQESNAAIQQLGQALASGRLAGDELRSILENAPPLARAIADGLGVSVGKLRELGEAGTLTSTKVFQAILKQQGQIEKNFAKIQITYGQAFGNLGNSLLVLFAEVKAATLGSTGSLAETINDLANNIFKFAINFRIALLSAKTDLALFVTNSILSFYDLWDTLDFTSEKISEVGKGIYKEWEPAITNVTASVRDWAIGAIAASIAVSSALVSVFENTNFGKALIESSKNAIIQIRVFLGSAFKSVTSSIPTIDIKKFLPGLDGALVYIKTWAQAAERWFFFLYDKVVGRSWIPDLVIKITEWLAKLSGKPTSLVSSFASKLNLTFSNLKVAAPFVAGLTALYSYKSELLTVLGIAGTIGAVFAGVSLFKSNNIKVSTDTAGTSVKDTTTNVLTKSLDWLKKIQKSVKDSFDQSATVRTIKQILGMPDRVPGKIFGENIDTTAEVGRGPYRKYSDEVRGFSTDFINAFPRDVQVPLVAGFTGILALAILKAFDSGTTRTVLLSVLTSAAAIFASRTIDPKLLNQSFGKAAFFFLEILEKGLTGIFSGNVLRDPVGVLSLIAKSALLFEKGREALGKAAIGIATAPTKLAQASVSVLERSLLNKDVAKTNRELAQLPGKLNTAFQQNQREARNTVSALASLRDSTGALIGTARARAAVSAGDTQGFGTRATGLAAAQAVQAQRDLQRSQANLNSLPRLTAALTASAAESQRRSDAISETLKAQKDAFREGVKNIGAGAGGILGGLAGFQVGTEIAKGMTNSPEWVKVGTALAISFAGQAVGAGIGNLIAATLIAAASTIGGLMASGFLFLNPFARGALIIGAALYAGYEIFKNLPEDWKNGVKDALTAAPTSMGAGYKASSKAFETGLVEAAIQGQTPEERKAVLASNEKFISAIGIFSTTLEKWLRENGPTPSNPAISKATGGWIRGSGTGTSDSIPAMLSNGEFVVNAKDARENWETLTAINSGATVKRFAEGTTTVQNLKVAESGLDKFLKIFNTSFEKLSEKLKDSPLFKVEPPKPLVGGPNSENRGLVGVLNTSKDFTTSLKQVSARLESVGFEKIDFTGLDKFARDSPDEFKRIAELLDKSQDLLSSSIGQSDKLSGFLRTQNKSIAQQNFAEVAKILSERRVAETPSKYKTTVDIKPTEILFGEQLAYINKAFPELNLTTKDLLRITDDVRENIFANAVAIARSTAELDKIPVGTLEGQVSPQKALERRQGIETQRTGFVATARETIKDFRVPFEDFKIGLDEIGQSVSKETFNLIDDFTLNSLNELVNSARESQRFIETPGVPKDLRADAQVQFGEYIEKLKKAFDNAASYGLKGFDKFKKEIDLPSLDLDKRAFNLLSDVERSIVKDYAAKIKAKETAIDTVGDEQRVVLQSEIDSFYKMLSDILVTKSKDYKSQAQMAGEAFSSSLGDGFTSAFKGLLKGESSVDSGIWVTFRDKLLDNISGTVIDTFVTGLTNPLVGKDGILQKGLTTLGTSIFETGSKAFTSLIPSFGKTASPFSEPLAGGIAGAEPTATPFGAPLGVGGEQTGTLTKIYDGIVGGFESSTDVFSGVLGAVSGGFSAAIPALGSLVSGFLSLFGIQATEAITMATGLAVIQAFLTSINAGIWAIFTRVSLDNPAFASGGLVKGAGTGKSDSISAMLSNGEFVVNAKATKDNFSLLSAINSGNMKGFALGGMVSTSMISTPSPVKLTSDSAQSSSQQVININVTGDISRQTKTEIYRMLPSISEGVNAHNREKGYKG
jgi:tape measure domain-containing protein